MTELRHCLHISIEIVRFLAENIGRLLGTVSEKRYVSAMSHFEDMIRAIAKMAMAIDETAIQISYPGQGQVEALVAQPECHFTVRSYSICNSPLLLIQKTGQHYETSQSYRRSTAMIS